MHASHSPARVPKRAPRLGSRNTLRTALTGLMVLGLGATAHAQPAIAEPTLSAAPEVASAPPSSATPAVGPLASARPKDVPGPLQGALSHAGCQPAQLLEHEGRLYAACGAGGVLVFEALADGTFVLRERRQSSGLSQSLFLRGDMIWVETSHLEARPLAELSASAEAFASPAGVPVPTAQPIGKLARYQASTSLLAPQRIGGLWSVEGALRPYLPLQSLGVALLASGAVTYRGERAWYAQLQLMPLGGTLTKGQDAGLLGGSVSAGYDHQYFSLGLGVGTLRRGEWHDDYDPVQHLSRSWVEHSYGLAVTQHARLGALDGLNFMLTNAFVLDKQRWRFGYFDLSFQVPLNRQTWLTAAGGGGRQAGFLYSELGLKRLLRGDRGSGSLFVKPSVGVAAIDNLHDGFGAGPMIACQVEWRR